MEKHFYEVLRKLDKISDKTEKRKIGESLKEIADTPEKRYKLYALCIEGLAKDYAPKHRGIIFGIVQEAHLDYIVHNLFDVVFKLIPFLAISTLVNVGSITNAIKFITNGDIDSFVELCQWKSTMDLVFYGLLWREIINGVRKKNS